MKCGEINLPRQVSWHSCQHDLHHRESRTMTEVISLRAISGSIPKQITKMLTLRILLVLYDTYPAWLAITPTTTSIHKDQ